MPATSYTRSTASSAIGTEMQDATGTYYTATIKSGLINQGMAQVAEDTQCRRATTTITVNAGQAEYSLTGVSPRVLDVLRVALPPNEGSTDEQLLQFVTMEDLDAHDSQWRSQTGNPTAYMRWGQGFNAIRIYPEPDTTYTAITDASAATFSGLYGGVIDLTGLTDSEFDSLYGGVIDAAYKYGSLRVDYVAQSTDLTSDSDSLETVGGIPVQYQDAVIWYACARLCEIDVAIAQQQKAAGYWAKYAAEIGKANDLTANSFQSKPTVESVGYFY